MKKSKHEKNSKYKFKKGKISQNTKEYWNIIFRPFIFRYCHETH